MATFNNGESLSSVRTKINAAIDKVDGNATISNDITFGDNNKAIFGAGSDLEIYHNGTHNIIQSNEGNITIETTSDDKDIFLKSDDGAGGSATYLQVDGSTGSLNLRHYGDVKLATTSTGIDVTGTVTADGLTVGGSTSNAQYADLSSSGLRSLRLSSFANNGNDNAGHDINASSSLGAVTLSTGGNTRFKADSNGDISFYEDTGVTPKMVWKAADERLGIGTDSPSRLLDVSGVQGWENSGTEVAYLNPTATGTDFGLKNSSGTLVVRFDGRPSGDVYFNTGGNVGIGTDSPSAPLHVAGDARIGAGTGDASLMGMVASGDNFKITTSSAVGTVSFDRNVGIGTDSPGVKFVVANGSDADVSTQIFGADTTSEYLGFGQNGSTSVITAGSAGAQSVSLVFRTATSGAETERMRIDSSGNVGIGTSSPSFPSGSGLSIYDSTIPRINFKNSTTGTAATDGAEIFVSGSTMYIQNRENAAIVMSTNGTNAITINNSQNVGIGTSSPDRALHVNTSQDYVAKFSSSDAGAAILLEDSNSTANYNRIGVITHDMQFVTNNAERMRIDSSGNVGIGTSSPSAKLSVTGLAMNSASSGVELEGAWPWLKFKDTEANQDSWLQYIDGSNFILKQIDYDDRNSAPSTVGTERMRINSSGNVGIGTISPSRLLDVNGIAKASIFDAGGEGFIRGDASGELRIQSGTTATTFRNNANNTEYMRIDSSGNVGIGTTNPDTPLHVVKNANSSQMPIVLANENATASSTSQTVQLGFGLSRDSGTVKNDAGVIEVGKDSAWTAADTNIDSYMAFQTYTNNSSTEKMRIDSSGNVGIGTSSPNNYSANHKSITLNAPTTPLIDLEVNGTRTGSFVADSTKVDLNAVTSVPIRFLTADTERMRIDSSGNVGIGTSDPAALGGGAKLTVNQAADGNIVFARGASTRQVQLGTTSTTGYINADNTSGGLAFHMNGTERMRIDSSGNVALTGDEQELRFHSDYSVGNTDRAKIKAIGAGGGSGYGGDLVFYTKDPTNTYGERMRIDSSGNLLVGKTSTGINTAGSRLIGGGAGAQFTADGTESLALNRIGTSDGDLIWLGRSGSKVGSIGSEGSDSLFIQGGTTSGAGLLCHGTAGKVLPVRNGASIDATIDLGQSTRRFKDLYLSGGVYLGGTGAANHLDDYEEGTWTPTLTASTGNPTVTYTTQKGRYVKVGQVVTVSIDLRWTAQSGGSGNTFIAGFPFSNGDAYWGGQIFESSSSFDWGSGRTVLGFEIQQNNSQGSILVSSSQNGSGSLPIANVGTGSGYLIFSFTYRAAS